MASNTLTNLLLGLDEIDSLQRANPTPQQGGGFTRSQVVRAVGRAEVVLLCSHLERYIYGLNEETLDWLVSSRITSERLPEDVRLLHVGELVDALAATQWDRRATKLREYSELDANLWIDQAQVVRLEPDRLLRSMKSPRCNDIVRYFRLWGIDDIFTAITRSPVTRQRLWLRIGELVDKRNYIAHGDLTVEARYLDIEQYKAAVRKFSVSADRAMARAVARISGAPRPW